MTTWRLPVESKEWVGPLAVEIDGDPAVGWKVAVIAVGTRPVALDWGDPVADPDDIAGGVGVIVGPTSAHALAYGEYRIWIKTANGAVVDDAGTLIIV